MNSFGHALNKKWVKDSFVQQPNLYKVIKSRKSKWKNK